MKNVAIIPLRSGSKGIPGKNKKKLLGRPLYQWVLSEAVFSKLDEVFVFTDDSWILEEVEQEYGWTGKVRAMRRSDASASDTASTETAMLEFAENIHYDFDVITLLQATSPLTTRSDIDACLDKVLTTGYDSALTAVKVKRFTWSENGESINYNYLKRPRRQDFDGMLIENGAVYCATKACFQSTKNRLGRRITVVQMPEDTLTEIDELSDWVIVEKLIENRLRRNKGAPARISAMVFDIDGVFTDGTVGVGDGSELFKRFSVRDGMGFELLRQERIIPIVMTSENSGIVTARMKKLKIDRVYSGVRDKFARLGRVLSELGLGWENAAYVGDDINDLACMASVAWAFAPKNANARVKDVADVILDHNGGDMAVREAIEFAGKYNSRFSK